MVGREEHSKRIIDLKSLGQRLPHVRAKVIAKTKEMEIQEVTLKAGEGYYRVAPGPLVVQCLKGEIELSYPEVKESLAACQLVYVKANEPYSITALSDSTLLMIITFQSSDPANPVPPK